MTDCKYYLEHISAYADDEISESDKLHLEAHLAACKHCSSILEAFRGISQILVESSKPAPESLSIGVMEKIMIQDTAHDTAQATTHTTAQIEAKIKIFRRVNLVLTRYIPAAACLAFLLLTVPRLFGIGGMASRPGTGSSEAPMPSSGFLDAADTDITSGSGSESMREIISESAPINPEENADELALYEDDNDADFEAYVADGNNAVDHGFSLLPAAQPEEASPFDSVPPITPAGDPPEAEIETPELASSSIGNVTAEIAESETEAYPSEALAPADAADPQRVYGDLLDEIAGNYDPAEPASIFDSDSNNAYAVIMIIGEFPAILDGYSYSQTADSIARLYEIPFAAALELIGEISGKDGATINITDENGTYALVYYTP